MNYFHLVAAVSWIVDAGSLLQSCLSGTDALTTTTYYWVDYYKGNVDYDKG